MVFTSGRGRAPKETPESGAVSWDEDSGYFLGSNNMFWHGTKHGGWKSEKPVKRQKKESTADMHEAADDVEAEAGPKAPKGRKPKAPTDGCEVTYDFEKDCYKTDEDPPRYWTGSKLLGGKGWSKRAPGDAPASAKKKKKRGDEAPEEDEAADEDEAEAGPKAPKGRKPKAPTESCEVTYDFEKDCYKTDEAPPRYWTGSEALGGKGWSKRAPSDAPASAKKKK